jgi:hypothetical protein
MVKVEKRWRGVGGKGQYAETRLVNGGVLESSHVGPCDEARIVIRE